jgi:hypothetical protein
MELVADMFADGKNPLVPTPPAAPTAAAASTVSAPVSAPPNGRTILAKQTWPTQANLRSFYGSPGSHLTHVPCPWPLHIEGKTLTSITIHENGLERSVSEPRRLGVFFRHHSTSRARAIAGLSGFFTLSQSRDRPDR